MGIGRCVLSDAFAGPQNVVSQRMSCKQQILKLIENQLGRRVLIALDLVAHHLRLFFNLMLRILAAEDDVGQHIDRLSEVLARRGGIIDRVFFVGKSIQFAPNPFERIDDLHSRATMRSFE